MPRRPPGKNSFPDALLQAETVFSEKAMEAIRGWRFEPATDVAGLEFTAARSVNTAACHSVLFEAVCKGEAHSRVLVGLPDGISYATTLGSVPIEEISTTHSQIS